MRLPALTGPGGYAENGSGPSNLHSRACASGPGRLSAPSSSSPERSLLLAPKTRSLGTGMTTFGVARLTSCAYTSQMPNGRFAPLNERFLIHQQVTQVVGVLFPLEPKSYQWQIRPDAGTQRDCTMVLVDAVDPSMPHRPQTTVCENYFGRMPSRSDGSSAAHRK
jgi:hypothetical protein